MHPKPAHLAPEYGAQFQDKSVVAAYPSRPPYPAATFVALANLIGEGPRIVLDVGCGTGDIARRLAPLVGRVEAIDVSAAMLERGRSQPGGAAPNLAWVYASVEDAPLRPPYGLITAGESLHWLDWEVVFPRFAEVLSPSGVLAIIGRDWGWSPAFTARLHPIIDRYSTNRDFRPYNLTDELTTRGLFELMGTQRIAAEAWHPTIAEYIECRHSQNGLSRERMGRYADAFDAETRAALLDLVREDVVELRDDRLLLTVEATITWGRPLAAR